MDLFFQCHHSGTMLLSLTVLLIFKGASSATFTFVNKCDFTVWPGILSGAGSPKLESTGFQLPKSGSRTFQAPTGWSGRFWGRTGCNFEGEGSGSCVTADCGSGTVECSGRGATPPATLAEFTLGSGSEDFYDVSLVDGYNLPMIVEVKGGSGSCGYTGCVEDLNQRCPAELKVDGGGACRSACEAFGKPEYCCSGAYNTAMTCKPSTYSQIFKSACPRSYSYAYDDASSTFTCTGADYTITFCPSLSSLKSSRDSPKIIGSTTPTDDELGAGSESGLESDSNSEPAAAIQQAELATSWLANLAVGDSTRNLPSLAFTSTLILTISLILSFLIL